MDTRIQKLLYAIGLTANYAGYRQIMVALEIAVAEPETLRMVTKRLYPETARRCGTNWKAVERNIRTALRFIWNNSRHTLEEITGYSFETRPKPAQFLAILVYELSDAGGDSFPKSLLLSDDPPAGYESRLGPRSERPYRAPGAGETGIRRVFPKDPPAAPDRLSEDHPDERSVVIHMADKLASRKRA